jgi:hypothetical protein
MGVVNCDDVFFEWHSLHALSPANAAKGTVPFVGHQRWLFTRSFVALGESAEGGDFPSTAIVGRRHNASTLMATAQLERAERLHGFAGGFNAALDIAVARAKENHDWLKNVSTLPEPRQLRKVYFSLQLSLVRR